MKKTLAALGLSIALAAGSLAPAPALAAGRDGGTPAMVGLLAAFAVASTGDRDRSGVGRRIELRNTPQAPAWGYPVAPRQKKEARRAVRERPVLPAACVRDIWTDGRWQVVLSERCLRRNNVRSSALPARCETGAGRWGKRTGRSGWAQDCLRRQGYVFR